VFGGNDRPGVMLASAMRTYVNRYRGGARQARRGVHERRRRLAYGDRPRAGRYRVAAVIDSRPQAPTRSRAPAGVRVMQGSEV
jgi:sarcosine oxidase subunit alpha